MRPVKEKPRPLGERVTGQREKSLSHPITNWLLTGIKVWVVHRLAERLHQDKCGAGVQLATLVWWRWRGSERAI